MTAHRHTAIGGMLYTMTRNRPRVAVTTGGMAQPIGPVMQYLAYLRVSTNRQSDSGAGIEAHRTAILAEAQRRGWNRADVQFIEEAASGKNVRRPGLELAREALAKGEARALVVSKMDRLSRSLLDFAS